MVDFFQMGILVSIPLMANVICLNSSPRVSSMLGSGTGFGTRPRIGKNAKEKEGIEDRRTPSLETEDATDATSRRGEGGGGGGGGSQSEPRCLADHQDQVKH